MFKFTVVLFPNLFRSFSNQHHFPEVTTRIPLKVQLISHLRICSHFSRYNSFSFTICRYWYMQYKICIQAKLLQATVLEPRKTDVLVSGYRSLAWERPQIILRTKEIKRYLLSKELFGEIRMGILFVGFTLEGKLVISTHVIQMHLYFTLFV